MARRDDLTLDLPGVARRRGRPASGKAQTSAQRQAAYRKRLQAIPREVYDAAWDAVKQAIRGDSALTIEQARAVYQAEVVKAKNADMPAYRDSAAAGGFVSCSASTTATNCQK